MQGKKKCRLNIVCFILAIMAVVVLLLLGGFFIYTQDYYRADDSAISMIEDNDGQIQKKEDMILFYPENKDDMKSALIFYPGGKVEASAYAPFCETISQNGILCIILRMPFHLAVFDINAADTVYEQFPEIENWYLGGHSLGGAMASSYASKHTDLIKGLILLGAYPTESMKIPTVALYGSEDKILDRTKLSIVDYAIQISGGNHAYFGNYGEQKGDGTATISREEQQSIVTEEIVKFVMEQD